MRLDLYKKDFDTIPTYTSLVLLIFERLSTFHKQAYTFSCSDLPYRFVVYSLLYDSYPMGWTSTSTSLMTQLVQAVIPHQHDAFVGLKRFGEPFED